MDPLFRVTTLAATPNPQTVIWQALHQDYSEHYIADEAPSSETKAGEIAVKQLLAGNRGHYGPLEHPQITLACGYFPHSTMQQARTHRIASFDVQSGRYTGQRIIKASYLELPLEEVFYLRPIGDYTDRQGKKYHYSAGNRDVDLGFCMTAAERYTELLHQGFSEEHARGILPFDLRQHFVVSFSLRSLMHFLAIRGKLDAQLEIQQLCHLILPHFQAWTPQIYDHFMANQWLKGRLAP